MKDSPFEQVVVLFNPASTHAMQAKKRIENLRQLIPADRFLLLEARGRGEHSSEALLRRHADKLGPHTLLCIAAGDGTVNIVVESIAFSPSKKVRQTVILPLWGGNANDVAHMLNGPAYRMPVKTLLARGKVVSVRPLSCTFVDASNVSSTHIAVGYIGFGASALAARRLNEPPHRTSPLHNIPGGRLIQELYTVFRALWGAPAFRIEEKGGQRLIYERIFINGSRIGKVRPLPLRLTDDAYYKTTIDDRRLGAAILRAREMLRKPAVEKASEVTKFVCVDEAWAQFDGETVKIKPGTMVKVSRAHEPLRALSVRLPAK